jgi:hypothetical protein
MEIYKEKNIYDEVNRKNSQMWIRMNDNSRASAAREQFVKNHGGFFEKRKKNWYWVSPVKEKNGYRLKNINTNEIVFFENMKEFGEKHGLSSVKICELLNGKRKTYKGWTANELREVKEGTGQHVKEKEKKATIVKVYNGATFKNINTNEIFYVENISEFAKNNNINSGNLYKVAKGKMKSYKGLKLFNPLDDS